MNISILGAQGSGKGTQAQILAAQFDFLVFESGKELRRVAQADTSLGQSIKQVLNSGELIPDEQIYFLTKDWLSNIPLEQNILFDGYPRKMSQERDLERILADRDQKIDLILFMEIADDVAVKRLLGRLHCQANEHVFNLETRPPKAPAVCDFDGSPLVRRSDETPETIRRRLTLYHEETEPLIIALEKQNLVRKINADQPVDKVTLDLIDVLINTFPQLKK